MTLKSTIQKDNYLKILILLTITGLILRLWHIGDVSFWLDETLMISYSHQSFISIGGMEMDAFNPPTWYWIEHAVLYFGSGEAVLRLVPALLGTCTIPLFYLLGREFHNRETGLVAAALLTVSTFHIYYSQEARSYTLFLFCYSLALIFYLHAWKTSTVSSWVLFGIFSALSWWTHLFGFIFVVPLFLHAFLVKFFTGKTEMKALKPVILAGVITSLFSLPMLLAAVHASLSKAKADEVGSWGYQGFTLISMTIQEMFGRYTPGIIILCILFLAGFVWILYTDRKRFLFLVIALTLPLVAIVSLSYRMPIVSRYLTGLLPFLFLGISYAICSVHYRIFTIRFSCIAVLLLVAISIPSLNLYYAENSKYGQDWKGFSPELHNLTGGSDTILVYRGYHTSPLTYYYNNGTEHTFVYGINNKTNLEEFIRQNPDQKKMLIIVGSENLEPAGEIGQWINSHAVLVEKHEELYLYRIINSVNRENEPENSGMLPVCNEVP
jgi:mannosyltransferase